jgi:hypothetical protein
MNPAGLAWLDRKRDPERTRERIRSRVDRVRGVVRGRSDQRDVVGPANEQLISYIDGGGLYRAPNSAGR